MKEKIKSIMNTKQFHMSMVAIMIVTILFVVGIIDVFGGDVAWIIVGSLIILFCPLWVKSP